MQTAHLAQPAAIPRLRSGFKEKAEVHGRQYKKTLALFVQSQGQSIQPVRAHWIFI